MKLGAKKDGKITAFDCDFLLDAGAFIDHSPGVTMSAGVTVGGPYYWAEHSYVDWPLPAGASLYAQADSAGDGAYGGVPELDEIRGEPYNNILGPVFPR